MFLSTLKKIIYIYECMLVLLCLQYIFALLGFFGFVRQDFSFFLSFLSFLYTNVWSAHIKFAFVSMPGACIHKLCLKTCLKTDFYFF